MGQAHAEGFEHEALTAHTIEENAAVSERDGGEFGEQEVQGSWVGLGGLGKYGSYVGADLCG